MFIDPEPRKPRHAMSTGLAAPRAPSAPARERDHDSSKRRALHERSQSQNNRDRARLPLAGQHLDKLTVRLIAQSPASSTKEKSSPEEWVPDTFVRNKENTSTQNVASRVRALSHKLDQDESFVKSVQRQQHVQPHIVDINLSETTVCTNDEYENDLPPTPRRNSARLRTDLPPRIIPPKPSWHRRSASSGVISQSSTLYPHRDSESSAAYDGSTLQPTDDKHESYLSLGTTLRDTPTPVERNFSHDRNHDEFTDPMLTPRSPLHAWPEISPERSTVRIVDSPVQRHGSEQLLQSEASVSSLARTMSIGSEFGVVGVAQQARVIRRATSTSSLPNVQTFDFSPSPSFRDDMTSFLASEDSRMFLPQSPEQLVYSTSDERSEYGLERTTSNVEFSSPNIITYSTPPPRSPTRRQLHTAPSYDSIDSRIQPLAMLRSDTTPSFAERISAPSTIHRPSSADTLPNLYLPKKRVRPRQFTGDGRPGSTDSPMAAKDVDQGPLGRQAFSTHLSTIMSESDRADSRHMSQFSANSNAFPNYPSRYLHHAASWSSQNERNPQSSVSGGVPDDAGSEFYREQSAIPLPLFQNPLGGATGEVQHGLRDHTGTPRSDSTLTSVGEREESSDQVAELYPSRLHGMRSGQSLRQRSNSTPSHSQPSSQNHSRRVSLASYQSSSDRPISNSSNVFPFWAKQYYGRGVALLSPSSVSLELSNSQQPPLIFTQQQQYIVHSRGGSEWTDVTSSSDGVYTDSSASSRFLPSIFRPRTRIRLGDQRNVSRTSQLFSFRRSQQPSSAVKHTSRSSSSTIRYEPTPSDHNGRVDRRISPPGATANHGASEAPPNARPHHLSEQMVLPSSLSPRQSRRRRSEVAAQPLIDRDTDGSVNQPQHTSTADTTGNRIGSAQQAQAAVQAATDSFQLEGTPHLYLTRRGAAQNLPTWRAPSFVDSLDTLVREKGNRQILFFVLGFACPLFWLVGAFLPIPPPPTEDDVAVELGTGLSASPSWIVPHASNPAIPNLEPTRANRQSTDPNILQTRGMALSASYNDHDFATVDSTIRGMMHQQRQEQEHQAAQEFAAHYSAVRWAAERKCLKARWWRTLNRVMSVVGILVIGAIIALAVVATSH